MWPFDDVLSAFNSLFEFLVSLAQLLLYPFICLIATAYSILDYVYSNIASLLNLLLDFPALIIEFFADVFSGVFPSAWVWLFGLIFSINVGLRVYSLLRGVSIFGWSL